MENCDTIEYFETRPSQQVERFYFLIGSAESTDLCSAALPVSQPGQPTTH